MFIKKNCLVIIILIAILFLYNNLYSQNVKIPTISYSIILDSFDTSDYRGEYRKALTLELKNSLFALGNYYIIPPQPENLFDSIARSFVYSSRESTNGNKDLLKNKNFFHTFSESSQIDGLAFFYSLKLPVIPPQTSKDRAIFILQGFLFDFKQDSLIFFRQRIVIGNEWTILSADVENLFLDTIKSDYHDNPYKGYIGPLGNLEPYPSPFNVPDSIDSVFSQAMDDTSKDRVLRFYNENMSYNVYSCNECPTCFRGIVVDDSNYQNAPVETKCDSCRSFFILNYFPTGKKPNQYYNKINFKKCCILLEAYFSSNDLSYLSYPSNLYSSVFYCGIRDFCKKDSSFGEFEKSLQRPIYIWAENISPQNKGLEPLLIGKWIDGSKNISKFYSLISTKKSMAIAKPKKRTSYFIVIAIGIIAVVLIFFQRISSTKNKSFRNVRHGKKIQNQENLSGDVSQAQDKENQEILQTQSRFGNENISFTDTEIEKLKLIIANEPKDSKRFAVLYSNEKEPIVFVSVGKKLTSSNVKFDCIFEIDGSNKDRYKFLRWCVLKWSSGRKVISQTAIKNLLDEWGMSQDSRCKLVENLKAAIGRGMYECLNGDKNYSGVYSLLAETCTLSLNGIKLNIPVEYILKRGT